MMTSWKILISFLVTILNLAIIYDDIMEHTHFFFLVTILNLAIVYDDIMEHTHFFF